MRARHAARRHPITGFHSGQTVEEEKYCWGHIIVRHVSRTPARPAPRAGDSAPILLSSGAAASAPSLHASVYASGRELAMCMGVNHKEVDRAYDDRSRRQTA